MSIDAMKQALEALESLFSGYPDEARAKRCNSAITALREAIEQAERQGRATAIENCPYDTSPATDYWIEGWQARAALKQAEKQEPVAWLWQHSETGRTRIVMRDSVITVDANWAVVGPLYLHPPQRQPLSADALWASDAVMAVNADLGLSMADLMRFARAIESAHGITGDKQ